MNDTTKARQLKKHKQLATGLFVLMLLVYVLMSWLLKIQPASWMGYVKAFAEAAMVGALADWFAVTALFHHPLGIPIPHTNLIEHSKKAIGNNLGNFVVDNFLTPANIRPYMQKLSVSAYAAQWLQKEKNKQLLLTEGTRLLSDVIKKLDDKQVADFIAQKAGGLLQQVQLNKLVAQALHYFTQHNEQEKLVTGLAQKIKEYILDNHTLVKEKVQQESYFFIPKFVDNKLAEKITNGLAGYFNDIATDPQHHLRAEITAQLQQFTQSLTEDEKWTATFAQLKENILPPEKLQQYAGDIWQSLKATLVQELGSSNSSLQRYLAKSIDDLAQSLYTDIALQQKIDGWVRHNAYRYILRNTQKAGTLISDTIGNWPGKALSQKLELEVGKDLQFIRINGTIVGGLVGLVIYVVSRIFE